MRRVAMVLFGVAAVLLIAVVALVAGSGGSHPSRGVRVLSATTSDDSRIVDLTLAECPTRLFGSLDEEPDLVRVDVTTSSSSAEQHCTREMPMVLQSALKDRSLVDGSSGQPVTVQKVPASQLQGPLTRRIKR